MISLFSDIVESNNLASVLAFLLVAPERSFTAKELSSRLTLGTDKVFQALEDLEKQNYVRSIDADGVDFFRLNMRHAQVPLLKQELLKTEKPWQDELYIGLKKIGQMDGIFLSGVFVNEPLLPVDILLVGKVNLTKLDIFLKAVSKLMDRELNYSIMTAEEFISRRDTFDRFIKDIFDYPHLVVLDNLNSPKPAKSGTSKDKLKKK